MAIVEGLLLFAQNIVNIVNSLVTTSVELPVVGEVSLLVLITTSLLGGFLLYRIVRWLV